MCGGPEKGHVKEHAPPTVCFYYTRAAAAEAVAAAGRRLPLLSNTRRQAAKPLQEEGGTQADASQDTLSAARSGHFYLASAAAGSL